MLADLLHSLKFGGYAPRTLLDVGANLGAFSRAFVEVFPHCLPTLVEPNPHCLTRLRDLPFEVLPVAASNRNGNAELFLTAEWPETPGASLYRENTAFFRDEVLVREKVRAACLDLRLAGRRFDFVKIDVRGSEIDVLDGGAEVIREADYVLVAAPMTEYNIGAPPVERLFDKLAELGFRCAQVVGFHRIGGTPDGPLQQMDVLFERLTPRAAQDYRYRAVGDRADLLAHLTETKRRSTGFSVIGLGAGPWADEIADAAFGAAPADAPLRFAGDPNDADGWMPVLKHVERHGKFSYAVCSHLIEGMADPALLLRMLPRVAEAGTIAAPSKFVALPRAEGPYRGILGHRWIVCGRNGQLVLVPKIPLIDYLNLPDEEAWRADAARHEIQIFWRRTIQAKILDPGVAAAVDLFAQTLSGQDP